ncbi:MAG: hypothetical protein FWG69_01530 [Oscillospiraceae bacterium]|nr:hypothetical protein [Oscillospiraceae bacterium]
MFCIFCKRDRESEEQRERDKTLSEQRKNRRRHTAEMIAAAGLIGVLYPNINRRDRCEPEEHDVNLKLNLSKSTRTHRAHRAHKTHKNDKKFWPEFSRPRRF